MDQALDDEFLALQWPFIISEVNVTSDTIKSTLLLNAGFNKNDKLKVSATEIRT